MLRLPLKVRNDDDDYAPLDYEYVGSVAEGEKRRQSETIHRDGNSGVIRHRAEPDPRVDAYGTHARRSEVVLPQRPRIVYPQGYQSPEALDRQWEQENRGPLGGPPPAREETPPAEEYDPPVAPEIPAWLQVAKQNNMPLTDRHLRPQVTAAPPVREAETEPRRDPLGRPIRGQAEDRPAMAAPQKAREYESAGYPEALWQEQERADRDREAEQYGSKRHGAQRAVRQEPPGAGPRASRTSAGDRARHYGQAAPNRAQEYGQAGQGLDRAYAREPKQQDFAPRGYDDRAYDRQTAPPGWERESAWEREPDWERNQDWPRDSAWAPQAQESDLPLERAPRRAPPRQDPEEWYEEEAQAPKRNIPWLGMSAAALALLAVLLWILQMTYAGRTQQALEARTQQQEALINAYPYKYRELIETQSQINNLHPAFIAAIVLNESSFKPEAESSVGARGLMQMMPDTAEWVHGKIGEGQAFSFDMMYDANLNVRYACWYMKFLSEKFRGDPVLVAAAFHAGQGTVQNWLNDSRYSEDSQTIEMQAMMDGPTKNYVAKVCKAYAAYKRLYYENAGV